MPKQSAEVNTKASLAHVAKEISEIASDLASYAGDLDPLPVQRFWGGSKSGRELGLRNLRTLCDEVRNCIEEMKYHHSIGDLSALSVSDETGEIYRYSKAQNGIETKASDNGKKRAKRKSKQT